MFYPLGMSQNDTFQSIPRNTESLLATMVEPISDRPSLRQLTLMLATVTAASP